MDLRARVPHRCVGDALGDRSQTNKINDGSVRSATRPTAAPPRAVAVGSGKLIASETGGPPRNQAKKGAAAGKVP